MCRRRVIAAGLLLVVQACTAPNPRALVSPSPEVSSTMRMHAGKVAPHIFVVVLENHSYGQIIGNRQAAYLNDLARRFTLATDYHGITHPSLPNYLAMIGGSTVGITNDCTACSVKGRNVADQIESAGLTWKVYAEDLPFPCYRGPFNGRYAKKHNPFMYFNSLVGDAARCRDHVVAAAQLAADRDVAPNLSFIVPNLCNDMHDCDVGTGDRWVRSTIAPILESAAWRDNGILVVTFDEGSGASNHIATIVARPGSVPGTRVTSRLDHYSLLRAIEDAFSLPQLGGAASSKNLLTAT